MLRDNLVGLIEPMLSSAGANPLALCTAWKQSSDDRPPCLENPRPEGAESTLTENAASPFHAEPKQVAERPGLGRVETPKAALIVVMAESKLVRRHDSRVHYSRATEYYVQRREVRHRAGPRGSAESEHYAA